MMTTTRSRLVFACYDASCRPPTAGGTGGSKPKATGGAWVQRIAAINTSRTAVPVKFGRHNLEPDSIPPSGWGAGEWTKGKEGMWSSKGEGGQKYAIKGELSGEWFTAHLVSSRSQATPKEIHQCLKQLDFLQSKYPLPIKPEIVFGDFGVKKIRGVDPGTGGFTIRNHDTAGRRRLLITGAAGMNPGVDFPVGPNVIYINTGKTALELARYPGRGPLGDSGMAPSYYDSAAGTKLQYITTHEFGHLRDHQGVDKIPVMLPVMQEMADRGLAPISRYARVSRAENHAESFGHWVQSNGTADDEWTRTMAETLNWPAPDKADLDLS